MLNTEESRSVTFLPGHANAPVKQSKRGGRHRREITVTSIGTPDFDLASTLAVPLLLKFHAQNQTRKG